jgi:ABC-type Fe3+/spermidine/putrescine transport system ATPase subunit
MLEVEEISVRFGELVAVDRASLRVGADEILAVLGPSGSGKSTLLRVIAGLEAPGGGRVRFDGADITELPVHLRRFGLMFQNYALFPHLTVARNVGFGLRMQELSPAEVRSRVEEVLSWVGLESMAARKVDRLSGGEQQRVALARSLAPRPRLLMLDEPVGALDRQLRQRLVADIRRLLKEQHTPGLYVTHDHEEAAAVSDRVALMREGRIVQTAPYPDLVSHPADQWVADFVRPPQT